MTSVSKVSRNDQEYTDPINIRNAETAMIMDSGSESTVLKQIYPGILEGARSSNITLVYGDGVQNIPLAVGKIGGLEEVVVTKKF
jgi:hypothetical protein